MESLLDQQVRLWSHEPNDPFPEISGCATSVKVKYIHQASVYTLILV
jgi:hypothetical protein